MTFIGLLLVVLVSFYPAADGYGYGEWSGAHATFYGGSDASGTMGEFPVFLLGP